MKLRSMLFVGRKVLLPLVLLLAVAGWISLGWESGKAQQPGASPLVATPQVDAPGAIPIQGRLTNAANVALSGTYTMVFKLYNVETGGTALCEDSHSVSVTNGLFNSYIDHCYDQVIGQRLWLGITVGSDSEMIPRQLILPVPYALGLMPEADINGTYTNDAIIDVANYGETGRGVRSYALASTSVNYGVVGASASPAGFGGYFYNSAGGTGLKAQSDTGTALLAESAAPAGFGGIISNTAGGTGLKAESDTGTALLASGSGKISSTANSYLWISGNSVRPYRKNDSTVIDLDSIGGAKIMRGGPAGTEIHRNVMVPITITSPLYGQNVTVTELEITYLSETDLDAITAVLFRRQISLCTTENTCWVSIVNDPTDRTCLTPGGCTLHYDLTKNNVLTSDSGVLYLTIEMRFSGDATWVQIGGVRLTLKHN